MQIRTGISSLTEYIWSEEASRPDKLYEQIYTHIVRTLWTPKKTYI